MRSTAAVDDLILWHGAGILGLAWLIVAVASMDGVLARSGDTSFAKSTACAVGHECPISMHSSWHMSRR